MLLFIFCAILGLGPVHDAGYRGEGVKIAIIDAGFFRANDPSVFDQSHILGSYDLLPPQKRAGGMFSDPADAHGTCCLSTMLYRDSSFTGTAPDADYYLIRTEDRVLEDTTEISRLMEALRMADSLDVDVVTISLGYHQFDDTTCNYTYADLNGMSPVSQLAADIATRRIVCVAAGNEGDKKWHHIMVPADAQQVVTCGAVDSTGAEAVFSSWGPTADNRQKPELSAWGKSTRVYRSQKTESGYTGSMGYGNGTSFATPEVAGMFACLIQALPTLSVTELTDLVYRSADRYTTPDMHVGYGVPDATRALQLATGWEKVEGRKARGDRGVKVVNGQVIVERNGLKYTILGQKRE